MASLAELARLRTPDSTSRQIDHLQRLVASWGLLADFCFADLLLFVGASPERRRSTPSRSRVLGQVRPTTSQTLYRSDWVGTWSTRPSGRWSLAVARARRDHRGRGHDRAAAASGCGCCASRCAGSGQTIAVLTAESAPTVGRQPGELERTYVEVFNRFARMIASGEFPFRGEEALSEEAPRVGDGVILLDGSAPGRVHVAQRRVGAAPHRRARQHRGHAARRARARRGRRAHGLRHAPARHRGDRAGPEITVLHALHPAARRTAGSGAVVLLRDISELRRRDRLLLSKDATIREIHHRVKNNLQTISSLLRLQGRRLSSPEAKAAIEESVRRIRSIALVHEILSHEAGEDVPFIEIVRPAGADGRGGPVVARPTRCASRSTATPASCPPPMATPLPWCSPSCCRTWSTTPTRDEVWTDRAAGSGACSSCDNDGGELRVRVIDDGVGLPDGLLASTRPTGLGLSIVRTLVTTELAGTHRAVRRGDGTGTESSRGTVGRHRGYRLPDRCGLPLTGEVPVVGSSSGERGAGAASYWRRSLRRSSSEVPPQTPESWLVVEGELEARGLGVALAAHGLGRLDLLDRRAGRADREEQIGIGVAAGRDVAPIVLGLGFDGERWRRRFRQRSNGSEGHGASTRSGFTSAANREAVHMPPRCERDGVWLGRMRPTEFRPAFQGVTMILTAYVIFTTPKPEIWP